ncbi:UpxY family transcription antiterminator [Algicola sagamiensis]|uniref:UpxY family transcription antiterminator n=1 Tax=Algicola sagamiensis TaxID=163869 RepID=UPI0003827018|nr:UpxY family transcription antiterminator [Algicola sagamiensis]
MIENIKQWFVVYTHANAEKKFSEAVTQLGLESYLPLTEEVHIWSDRKKKVTVPVFKSYVFIQVDLHGLHQVKRLPGFSHLIRFGEYPTAIPADEIEKMKTILAHQSAVQSNTTRLVKGDRVRIFKGPMSGLEGVLTEDQGTQKVAIAIEKLNQSILFQIPTDSVLKIEEAA